MKCLSIHLWSACFVPNEILFVFNEKSSSRTEFAPRRSSCSEYCCPPSVSFAFSCWVIAFPVRTKHLLATMMPTVNRRIVVIRTRPPLRVQGEILRPGLRLRPNLLNSCHESHVQFFGTPPLSRYSCIDHRRFLPSLSGNFN